jgi:hypothetical protein
MIGIALVAFIATLTNGMKASNRQAIEDQIAADYVVTSLDGYTPFVAAAGDALAASSVPELVTSVRSDGGLSTTLTTEVGGSSRTPSPMRTCSRGARAMTRCWRRSVRRRRSSARTTRRITTSLSAMCSRFARRPIGPRRSPSQGRSTHRPSIR